MEAFLLEKKIVKSIIGPVDLNTAANTGLRVDMKNLKRVSFICILGAGTSSSAHGFALKQHSVASAGTPVALSVGNPYFHKIAAATSFTEVSPSAAADTYDLHSILGDDIAIVVFEVLAEQLSEGNRYVSLDITDSGGAQLGSVIAIGDSEFAPAYSQVV